MLRVLNSKVYDLEESVISCRNAVRLTAPEYTQQEFEKSLERAKRLAKAKDGSGERTFLKGIRVNFDLYYPNYISPELQRYHFFDIVQSTSKMHRILKMDFDMCCNKYVDRPTIEHMKFLIKQYNGIVDAKDTYDSPEQYEGLLYTQFMRIVSNCPQGIELFMRCSTNYLQLRTMYMQRKHHKLKEDWGAFIDWIKTLPYAKEFITLEEDGEGN